MRQTLGNILFILLLLQISIGQTQPFNEFGLPPPAEANEGLLQRNAMIFERSGDFETALEIYQRLRVQNPEKDHYLQGELRCLSVLGRYAEAVNILEIEIDRQIRQKKNAVKVSFLLIDLGDIYLGWGKNEEAWIEWEKVIAENSANPTIYRRISAALMKKRMVDEAVAVLKRGDAIIKRNVLSLDLARAYTNLMDYASATEYYIKYLAGNPKNSHLVDRAIFNFPDDEKTVDDVSRVLLKSKLPAIKRIIRGYLFSLGRYRESMDYLLLQETTEKELLSFASQLQNEKEYDLAFTAYEAVTSKFSDPRFTTIAQAGMADCLRKMGQIAEAMEIYWELAVKYPFTNQAEIALYNLGDIHLDNFNDPDSAEYYFDEVKRKFPLGKYRQMSSMMLGECAVRKGDLDLAEDRFNMTLRVATHKMPDLHSRAFYCLGKVLLWNGNPDSAIYVWNQLVKRYSGADIANDALNNILLFKQNQNNPLTDKYSSSWFAYERREFKRAEEGFRSIVNETPGSMLAGKSLIFLSEIYFYRENNSIKGFTLLEDYIANYPEAAIRDEILLNLADRCRKLLNDDAKAAHFYQKLIVEIPGSPLAPIARKKLEELGEEVILNTDLEKRMFIL